MERSFKIVEDMFGGLYALLAQTMITEQAIELENIRMPADHRNVETAMVEL